jgi:hypothetical protein
MTTSFNAVTEQSNFIPAEIIIPKMTAFFLDSFALNRKQKGIFSSLISFTGTFRSHHGNKNVSRFFTHCVKAKSIEENSRKVIIETQHTVRCLVRYIARHFNNVLMGICGNCSLIRLDLNGCHPILAKVNQTENLIQNGAIFIHLFLGYLAERNTHTKNLRLKQLIDEISNYIPNIFIHLDIIDQLHNSLASHRPRVIARNMARILDQLLNGIEVFTGEMAQGLTEQSITMERVNKIHELVVKGKSITTLLVCYADQKEKKAAISIFGSEQ